MTKEFKLNCAGKIPDLGKPRVMGVLNITPDSFYEGSRCPDNWLNVAEQMIKEEQKPEVSLAQDKSVTPVEPASYSQFKSPYGTTSPGPVLSETITKPIDQPALANKNKTTRKSERLAFAKAKILWIENYKRKGVVSSAFPPVTAKRPATEKRNDIRQTPQTGMPKDICQTSKTGKPVVRLKKIPLDLITSGLIKTDDQSCSETGKN